MPEQNIPNQSNRRTTADDNLIAFVKNIARAYGKMGLLSKRLTTQAVAATSNLDAVNRVIARVGQMDPESKKVFGNYFIGENLENLDMATTAPAILAAAYEYISEHRNDSDVMRNRFERLGAHVDRLSADFANSGGMVVNTGAWPLVDTNNIADAYAGLLRTFAARRADVEQNGDTAKVDEYNRNLDQLKTVIADYDSTWGLAALSADHGVKLEERWDDVWDALNRAELTPELKEKLHKWGFLDAKGQEIPQFTKNGRLDKNGRLAAIIDLARHDIAKKHAARVNETIDENVLEAELNEEIEFKLYNMATADKVTRAEAEYERRIAKKKSDPDYNIDDEPELEIDFDRLNNDPNYRAELINELSQNGAMISNDGYNNQLDADVNATAGWVARAKFKLGTASENVGDFFSKVFRPLKRVDRLANVRMTTQIVDKRQRRIDMLKRLAKGFGSAFIFSSLLTIASTAGAAALAAAAGISMASAVAISTAAIGGTAAIGMGVIQINRWRKEQKKADKPTNLEAFLANPRLVTSLVITLIATGAMASGAAGLTALAQTLGLGALGLGAGKNAIEAAVDTWGRGGSILEAIAAGIASAGAVIVGGFTGKATANAGINIFNKLFPNNTIFQTSNTHTETREVKREVTRSRTVTDWPTDTTHEAAVRSWFGARFPNNPEVMQGLLDAVENYNAATGDNVDPWAALRGIAISGGDPNHGVYNAPDWYNSHGYTPEQIHAAANALHSDGTYDPQGMATLKDLITNHLSSKGYAGEMPGHELRSSTDVYQTRGEMPTQHQETWKEIETSTENFDVTTYNRAHGDGIGMFGNYNRRNRLVPRDRIGGVDNYPFNPLGPGDKRHTDDRVITPVYDDDNDNQPGTLVPTNTDNVRRPNGDVITYDDPNTNDDGRILPPVDQNIIYDGEDVDDNGLLPTIYDGGVPARRDNRNGGVPGRRNDQSGGLVSTRDGGQNGGLVKPEHGEIIRTDDGELVEDKIFAVTRAQGKAWIDLHRNLERAKDKLKKANPGKARQLSREIQDIEYDINELRNKLGGYPDADINIAADQAIDRANLKQKLIELDNLLRKQPSEQKGKFAMADWRLNVAKVQNKIEELRAKLGAAAYESNLWYPEPVEGLQKQLHKKHATELANADSDMHLTAPYVPESRPDSVDTNVKPDDALDNTPDLSLDMNVELPHVEGFYPRNPDMDINNHRVPKLDLGRFAKSKKDNMRDDEIRIVGGDSAQEFIPDLSKPEQKLESRLTFIPDRPRHNERGGLIAALRHAYDKVKQRIPGRTYFVPRALEDAAADANLVRDPITSIRGVPVYLVDLSGNNTPITQNADRAVVLVDVNGLRIPFYLSNGNEGGIAGRWVPLHQLYSNGTWLTNMFNRNTINEIPELVDIADALNKKIGDIRNYQNDELTKDYNMLGFDGFVGGADAVEHVDPQKVFRLINRAQYDSNNSIFGTYGNAKIGEYVSAEPNWLSAYMEQLESPDYRNENQRGIFQKLRNRFGWTGNNDGRK